MGAIWGVTPFCALVRTVSYVVFQYIETYQYIESYLFLQRTLTVWCLAMIFITDSTTRKWKMISRKESTEIHAVQESNCKALKWRAKQCAENMEISYGAFALNSSETEGSLLRGWSKILCLWPNDIVNCRLNHFMSFRRELCINVFYFSLLVEKTRIILWNSYITYVIVESEWQV